MRPYQYLFAIAVSMLALAQSAHAVNPGDRVDNFRLLDQHGKSHELYYYSDMKAIVLMAQGNGCPIVRNALTDYKAVRDRYSGKGVEFLMINSNLQDTPAEIAAESKEFGIDLPVLVDDSQLIGESLSVTRTAEVFVINPKTWTLVYRGPLNDRLSYGAQKAQASKHFAQEALEAVLTGGVLATAKADAAGCLINFPLREQRAEHAKISYSETIAPLLKERCSVCHRDGGIGPWAMNGYDKIRGYAPMIREVIRTKRMPPWHADPHYGAFVGDRSLTTQETQTLVHWIEAGAPRGSGSDPLAGLERASNEWVLGKPDVVIEIPAYDVPATGVVDYQYPSVPNPLGRDVWVKAVEILPGNRAVVHHVLAGINDPVRGGGAFGAGRIGELGGYSPGRNMFFYPKDTGVLLRKDAKFQFQMHYTPNGKAATDVTRIGLYLHEKAPKYPFKVQFLMKGSIAIPAHAKAHTEIVEHTFENPVLVYTMLPHAHLRGKASKFTAIYPDGREEILLSVPKYDFNWQTTYVFKEPKYFPGGTRVLFEMTWDNSAQNPANPDPDKTVLWGEQTWEEMNAGFIRYRDAPDQMTGIR